MSDPTKPETLAAATEREQLLARLPFATARTLYRASLKGVPCQAEKRHGLSGAHGGAVIK
ncbi:MAG TPA: hypothetical protein VE093_23765 [Polyangiaceae bacterium]|jgi:hypothetical protein|nr:hypothetical protein [Polyangiaceae bacterium]